MNPDPQAVGRLFEAARQLATPGERAAFLQVACKKDAQLRERVEALLRSGEQAGRFLESPADTISLGLLPGAEPVPMLAEKPGDRIGHYKLLQQIGEGGCGLVYMAEQEEPVRRRVALKIIKLGMDTRQVVARFEAERQALALMDHPNIAKVLDAGATDTGRPFFVMELVKGIKITDYCDQNNLSTEERLGLFMQVCHAVQHAHQKGIIHRDIKPSNILVTSHDGEPVPKVIDFGIAKATGGQILTDKTLFTAFEQFIGTPAYMSPEQAEMSGLDIDTRTDIYSLGVLLYELLTGKTPFDQETLIRAGLAEMRRIIRQKEPARPSTRLSSLQAEEQTTVARKRGSEAPRLIRLLRGDLDWIVMKCLEKDRTRRYETTNGLAADVVRHLSNEPVTARPPSGLYRLQKLVGRNKLAFAAGGAVIAALIIGLGFATWGFIRERQARAVAVRLGREQAQLRREAEAAKEKAQVEASRADTNAAEARIALAASHFLQATRSIAEDRDPGAVAYLVKCLRTNPAHEAAAVRLATLLTYRSWCLPLAEPLKHSGWVSSVQFSPDGKRVVTASFDGTARVWDAQTGQPLTEPLKHTTNVWSAQFSPDGKRVVTASGDGTARVWDAQTGQLLTEPLKNTTNVCSARFSPDGKRVVTASGDGTARVWDAQTGQPLTEPLRHGGWVDSAEFSPDGKRVVAVATGVLSAQFSLDGKLVRTASADWTARVWDAQTGQPLTEPLRHRGWVSSAEFSPDGKRVVTASADNTARVWDAQTGQPLAEPLKHSDWVHSARFSPDGKRVVTASEDNTARVWDAQTGLPLAEPLKHSDSVHSAEFSPDGKRVVTASDDNTARVWDAQTGLPLTEPLPHGGSVSSAQFSPDGKRVVTVSGTTAQVWDTQTGQALAEPLKQTIGVSVNSAQFSPDGRRVVTAAGGTARVWDAQTGQALTEPLRHSYGVLSAQFSPDGKRVVTAAQDQTARVWDAQTGQPLTEPLKHSHFVKSAQFSPDGKRVVTASADGTARVWDAQTGQPLAVFHGREFVPSALLVAQAETAGKPLGEPPKQALGLESAQFSPDGKWVVTVSAGGAAWVWDAETGQPLTGPLKHTNGVVHSVEFSPDGKRVVTASSDQTARVWDAQTGEPVTEPLKHTSNVNSAQFSPDGKRVVTASDDNTARVWDAQTGQPLTEPLKHPGGVVSARFSPDGKRVVTASNDNTARVWDAQTGQPLTEALAHSGGLRSAQSRPVRKLMSREGVWSAQFSPDGRRVVTVLNDMTAGVWDVSPTGERHPRWLMTLAEAVCQERLTLEGVAKDAASSELFKRVREALDQESADNDWRLWGQWFLADRSKRTISPFSKVTVPEWIAHRIRDDTTNTLREAKVVAASTGNTDALAQVDSALSAWALIEQGDALSGERKFAQAEGKYREALAIRRKVFGNQDEEVAIVFDSLARVLEVQGKFADAEGTLREAVAIRFGRTWHEKEATPGQYLSLVVSLGRVLRHQGKLAEVEPLYSSLVKDFESGSLNDVAWRLATSNDPDSRDGMLAVLLAGRAVELTNRKDPMVLDTLAAAYAESGQFEKAVAAEKGAVALLSDENQKREFISRLRLYESNTPYHEEPLGTPPPIMQFPNLLPVRSENR
jgi:WD40 repeat protein/serine/threonine protein kinase/tetratricopeptide (TPR) repeat protein